MRITLGNNFHNTETSISVVGDKITATQYKRACKKLCGMKDCSCGDIHTAVNPETGEGYELEQINVEGAQKLIPLSRYY